ncbi:MAG: GAF domain-containing protein, partial [Pseudomonadales bacterium]|nr:GAF domain-containing protein [Pseudomonadales bacterium]
MSVDSNTYRRLIDIGLALSAEKHIDSLLERLLREAKSMANADAGTLYLKTEHDTLAFAILLNDSLGINQGGESGDPVSLPDVPLTAPDGSGNVMNIASRAAITGETVNIADVYNTEGIDAAGTKRFDELTGYRSRSFLTVPMKNYADETIGVLQLLNAKDESGQV